MSTFRRYPHLLEGKVCPECGLEYVFCEVEGCDNFAVYEGWVSTGVMLQRRRLCKECTKLTEAYKRKGEKVFEEVAK